jgi:hypothetical protein
MPPTIAMRSSDFYEVFPITSCLGDFVCPPTTIADPGITAQKTTRSRSQSDYEMQSGSTQVRLIPRTALNALERESQDLGYIKTEIVIDIKNTGEFNMVRLN